MSAASTSAAAPTALVPHTLKPNNTGIEIDGWILTSHKAPISSSTDIDEFQEKTSIKPPEMVFLSNHLILEHPSSGLIISFNTRDALMACKIENKEETVEKKDETSSSLTTTTTTSPTPAPVPMPAPKQIKLPAGVTPITATTMTSAVAPVKVTHAKQWANKHTTGGIREVPLTYDWTYTTTYHGTINQPLESSTYDIPMELVTSRDPILWYDQIHLFDDELHDNGISSLTLKVRVMERCFLILMQFWLRVDGVLIRIYDTRVFHEFGKSHVLHHVHKREETFAAMKQRGLPSNPTFYNDPQLLSSKLPIREIVKHHITIKK